MSLYITDTHPLVWYATNQHAKLTKKVIRIFHQAEQGQVWIYVPAVTFWEISLLVKNGRIRLKQPFDQWAAALVALRGFDLLPLELEVIAEAHNLTFDDPFDAAIVATARVKDLPLITKDETITDSGMVDVEW